MASAKQIYDGLVNLVSGLGTSKMKRANNTWEYSLFNEWQQLDAAYQTNWIARGVVDIPAQDMTREWRRIKTDQAEAIEQLEAELNLQGTIEEALMWARLYGGAGVLMLTNQDLSQPLDITKINKGDLKRFLVFDRWELSAQTLNTWDVLAPNYLMPEFYSVQGSGNSIHWSHVVRILGEKLPRRQLAKTQGWGDSVLRKCLDDVADMVAAKDGVAELMQEANIDTINREGLIEALASDEDSEIVKRYELFSQMKSIANMALLDKDEELTRQTLNLSGVAPILETFITWISGASKIPVTKLFGTSAKGLNATGEGDMRNYYDMIRADQRSTLTVPMRVLDEVLVRSAIGEFPNDYDYVWNPLQQSNDLEAAQAEQLRAQKNIAYLDSGIVQKSQVMRELQANEEYQYEEGEIETLEEFEEPDLFEIGEPEDPDELAPSNLPVE